MTTGTTGESPVPRGTLALTVNTLVLLLFPCSQQEIEVILDDPFNLAEGRRFEFTRTRYSHGIQPILRFLPLLTNMDMCWFVKVSLIEPESIALNTQDRRHTTPS